MNTFFKKLVKSTKRVNHLKSGTQVILAVTRILKLFNQHIHITGSRSQQAEALAVSHRWFIRALV